MSDYNTTVGVQIYDDFAKLQSELPKLISKLEHIKMTLGDISNIKISSQGLGNISKQLSKIVNIDTLSSNLSKLNTVLEKMNVGNLKAMREEITRLKQEYSKYVGTMNRVTGNKIKTANIADRVKNSNFNSSKISDLKGTRDQNITSYINHMNEGLSNVDKTAQRTKKSITSMFSLGKIYWFLNYTKQAFRGLGNVITGAMDFTETENYFSRAMGNMYDKAMMFQNKLTDMYGMSMNTMMNAQATYKNMIGSLGGLSDKIAYDISETVTKMTLDFSSLYNVDFDKTVQKMQSALSKQVRPIRSVSGFDITQNVLGATAQNLGISRSISQMNELEKRLLIIITLANQMRNSGAMNDFARTIEQPSNQLRILQEQIAEVGRWIGSVFYGVIGSVLPYINGFVMAIKELIKTFALFVGYKLPNSSGETETILDSLGASTNDVNNGLGNVGKNTDRNIKKAKEWKNVLMSFDVADVIPDQSSSDTSSNGGSGGGGGTGGMSVDPKILDALKNYNYLFDDIHMKAQDIRDELLKWAKIAQKAITDQIFKPMRNSWNTYGASTIKNFKKGFEDLKQIGSGVFDVVSVKWKPFFQSASNLFFSLMDTGSLVFSTITSIAKDVWKTGGKVFLEGVFDLTTAVLDLAKAINNDFVKPCVKLFKNTLGVVLSKTLGIILNLIGKFMTCLSKMIKLFSRNSTGVRLLSTSLSALWGVFKIGKITAMWRGFESTASSLDKFMIILAGSSKTGNKFVSFIENSRIKTNFFKTTLKYGIKSISDFFYKLKNTVSATRLYKVGISTSTTVTTGMTTAQTLAAKATVILRNALNFLANHPLVAVGIAIGTVVTALGIFASTQRNSGKAIEDCSQKIQDQYNDIKDLTTATNDAIENAKDHIYETEAEITLFEKYRKALKNITDEKGYVKNVEKARSLIGSINEILPNTFKLTDDGRVIQKKTNDEINKAIALKKKEAKAEAYKEAYIEALKNELKTRQKLNEAEDKLTDLKDKKNKVQNQMADHLAKTGTESEKLRKKYEDLSDQIEEQNSLVNGANKEWEKQKKSVSFVEEELSNLNDKTKETNSSLKKLSSSTKEAFDNIGENGKKEINKVISSLKDYDKKMSSSSKNSKKLSDSELKNLKSGRQKKIIEYGKLVRDYKLTYDQIIEKAEASGVKLTEKEKGTIKAITEVYKEGSKDTGDKFVDGLMKEISSGNYKTYNSSKSLAKQIQKAFKDNPAKASVVIESMVGQAKKRLSEAEKKMGKLKANAEIKTQQKNLDSIRKKLKNTFTMQFKARLEKKINKFFPGLGTGIISLMKIAGYAEGGFPDIGQMFIARENGIPELVGRMGSKNAVANNAQIENGIYKAVMNAIRDAGGFVQRGNNGDLHIIIQDENGRTKIEKIIKDYNNYMRFTGGKGGFII